MGRDLKAKVTLQSALGITLVCSTSCVMLSSQAVVQVMPVFGAWVSPCCLEPILLLEQGFVDDKLMLRTELQKQVPIVIAVANSVCTKDSFPQFEVSSHSCVEVS